MGIALLAALIAAITAAIIGGGVAGFIVAFLIVGGVGIALARFTDYMKTH